jgi:RHS repeat-associated protein
MRSMPTHLRRKLCAGESSFIRVRLLVVVSVLSLLALGLLAAPVPTNKPTTYPGWWFLRGVIVPSNPNNSSPNWPNDYPTSDDYAAINQGQLKNIATQAYAEMQSNLPASVWSTTQGRDLSNLITGWTPTNGDAYAVVNLGQLKTVAKPFYDVLIQAGYANAYPWTGTGADDYAVANIGQVKNVFSFDVGLHSDGSGLPDAWEMQYLGSLGNNPNALAPAGNGETIGQAYLYGDDPNNYYSQHGAIITPTLTMVSGNNQTGTAGAFLSQPLVVAVKNSSGAALINAPVTFNLAAGTNGGLANASGGATSTVISLRTDANGHAQVYLQLATNVLSTGVTVTAGTGTPVNFVEKATTLPTLSVISGNAQIGPAGQVLPNPVVIQATGTTGEPLGSVSLALTVVQGGGDISNSATGTFGSTLTISTNASGQASVYLTPQGANNTLNKVSCVATSTSGQQSTVYFTATVTTGAAPGGGTPPVTDQDPQAWGGSAYIVEADEDNGQSPGPNGPDPTQIDIHWWPTTGTGITGFLVEKKVSTGQWTAMPSQGTSDQGYYLDTGLQANEEVQYRVTPYINGILGSPCAPVAYQVPLLQGLSVQSSEVGSWNPGWSEFTNPSVPPKYYLTQTWSSSDSSGSSDDSGDSSGEEGSYNSTETLVPTPNPQQGQLQVNQVYSGNSQYSTWESIGDYSYSSSASASENAQEQWSGSYSSGDNSGNSSSGPLYSPADGWEAYGQESITQTTKAFSFNSSEDGSWDSEQSSDILSQEYTSANLIGDVNASFPDYGPWQNNWYGWGWYDWGYWGWGYGWNYGYSWDGYNSWWIADRYLNSTEDYYSVWANKYKLTAFPSKNINFQWAEIFVAQDLSSNPAPVAQRTKIVKTNSWNINSTSQSDSSVYEINPIQYAAQYGDQYGDYYIAPVPQLEVVDDGSSYLDSDEKAGAGAQVSLITGDITSQLGSNGPGIFYISGDGISGTTYSLSWIGSGDSTLQVWGLYDPANYGTPTWEQVTTQSAQNFSMDDDDGTGGWSGQFEVIATDQAQNNDSINLKLTSAGPDGTSLGSDSSIFTYTNSPDLSVPIDEASGSRYRKIALNGLPMADEKPQQSGETDQEKEETYIDALTLGLRHSTTDAYLPVSGSDFSVSAHRDFRSQVWNSRTGLRPHEQPDQPFGLCWSSNLAPNIKLTHNNDPTSTTPDEAIVTDETGAVHTFFRWYDTNGNAQFFPMPSAKNEAQVPNLETLSVNASANPVTYTFTRKYGAKLTYQLTTLSQSISNDRETGSAYSTTYNYACLVQAVDRVGNTINYQFVGATNLIPATITVANQPGIKLSIQQTPISGLPNNTSGNSQSVITAIWDANNNKTSYTYAPAPGDPASVVLASVTTPDGATTQYSYGTAISEADLTPGAPSNTYTHVDLASIMDPLGHTYGFTYNLDHSKLNYMSNPSVYTGYYIQTGCPQNIATVTMPDSTTAHPDVATFVNNSNVYVQSGSNGNLTMPGLRQNQVTDTTGFTRTYTFSNPDVISLPSFPQPSNNVTESKIIAYQNLNIAYGNLGSETFQFDINAAMALKQITDLSGNSTTFAHTDAWSAPSTYTQIIANVPLINGAPLNGYYDDPTSQIDALGQTNPQGHTKTFTYYGANRIMQSVTDENGNKTFYGIDSLGRRTAEKMYDPSGNEVQETDFLYGSTAYPGFMTLKTVKALGGSDPSWVQNLVTQYVPDANGRIAQEIVDPSGLNLVTSYTYDANGNKLTATDPRGHTTWFSYDSRNRLITVTNADGSQTQMVYDARGNKTVEYDENGLATHYQYDTLNRLATQTRSMNGEKDVNGNTIPDLVTSSIYNKDNTKQSTTNPLGGVTQMQYDNLQRVTQISTTPDNTTHYVTQFTYGANSGGNVFDSSSFKPTQTVDPRGFATDVTYDALYRPISRKVYYDTAGDYSTTGMGYDSVGNLTSTTDPLGNTTSVTYDALNRPVQTTYPGGATEHLSYTSTGLKWQVVDENGNITQTQYDHAGRPVDVIAAAGTSIQATTSTSYDAASNVAATINPLGREWDYTYDARNRKTQELAPLVTNAVNGNSVRPATNWQYDSAGRLLATIDPRGNETDYAYDNANRQITITSPPVGISGGLTARPLTQSAYDQDGNVTTLIDANGHATHNTYDLLNRLLTTDDAAGITVTNTYDSVGNKLTVKDGNLHTTTFAYDGLNRNTSITDPASHATSFQFNALNKVSRTDALSQVASYAYDARNRLITVTYPVNNATNATRHYSYDAVGNLLGVSEPAKNGVADVAYTYDALNRVITETSGGLQHAYAYDLAGNRLQTTYGGTGRVITSTYDNLNRLHTMTESGRTTTYGYDLNGNIVTKTAPNNDTEQSSFDVLNRDVGQVALTGSGGLLYSYAYGYDLVGNVLTVNETYPSGLGNRLVTNTYDAINRLTQEVAAAVPSGGTVTTTTYAYDNANNRTSKVVTGAGAGTTNYSYNNLNQLTGWTLGGAATSYTYDANGNRTTRSQGGATDTYSYDMENRLVGLVKATSGGTGTYAYTYDYRTRRITRDESAAGGVVTNLVFSGGTSVQEYTGAVSTADLTVEYIRGSDYGGGVGGILYTLRGGTPSYTHANRRGDIVAKTDGTGALTYQAQYAGFGNQTATNGSTLDRQKSNSKDTDPTGLVDEGMRYTDLDTGMRVFLTRDPAGFVDGPNLYTYVRQNPWTKFDPEGLADEEVVGSTEDDIDETGAGLRDNDPERDADGKPIFGSEEYEKENPPQSQAPSGPTVGNGPGQIPPMNLGPSLLPPQGPPKTDDEIALEVAKEMEAEKSNTPGSKTQEQQTNDNKEKTGDSTAPTPQKPEAKPSNGWKTGDPIDKPTAAGNTPAWSTARARYWKNEAQNNPGNYSKEDLERMQKGLAPQRVNPDTGKTESKELHHDPPQRAGGLKDVKQVWPGEHEAIDPYRKTGTKQSDTSNDSTGG